mmetsp:Transcript_68997/g.135597  ORF Transcript_68997/g.135597 Transcript_68997/m.135597 type:complete len:108 (+) Transcript_68997:713-1036(+)
MFIICSPDFTVGVMFHFVRPRLIRLQVFPTQTSRHEQNKGETYTGLKPKHSNKCERRKFVCEANHWKRLIIDKSVRGSYINYCPLLAAFFESLPDLRNVQDRLFFLL